MVKLVDRQKSVVKDGVSRWTSISGPFETVRGTKGSDPVFSDTSKVE